MENLLNRRGLISVSGGSTAALLIAARANGALLKSNGRVVDIGLASEASNLDAGPEVVAVRTAGYRLIGLGGALYVPAEDNDAGLPGILFRNGRRFRLADDELRALRPEVLGALGNGSVAPSGKGARPEFRGNDDSQAISEAIKIALRIGGTVVLSARRYRIGQPLTPITGPMGFIGAGSLKTWLLFDPEAEGDAFSIVETWMGKDPTEVGQAARVVVQPEGQSSGVTLAGFTLAGSRLAERPQNGIMLYERNDNVHIADVEIRHIKGRGFCSGISRRMPPVSLLRESRIDRLQVRSCGDRERRLPAFELSSDGYRSDDDASNNLTITDLKVIYSSGRAVMMDNRNPHKDIRYVYIVGAFFEGADDTVWTVRGSVTEMEVSGFEINGQRNPAAQALLFESNAADASTRPPRRCFFSGCFGPVFNGIRVRHGKSLYFRISGNGASGKSVVVESGLSGPVKFDCSGDERVWRVEVDPSIAHYVSIEPGRKLWSIREMPNPASTLNSVIFLNDIGDGRPGLARSNGKSWFYVPMDKLS